MFVRHPIDLRMEAQELRDRPFGPESQAADLHSAVMLEIGADILERLDILLAVLGAPAPSSGPIDRLSRGERPLPGEGES